MALLAIILLGFAVRMVGIDWDDGRYLHPDERHIVSDVLVGRIEFSWPPERTWLDPDESPINPRPQREDGDYHGFAYGTFPVYTVDIIGDIAESITGTDWNSYQRAHYIGRAISILMDTGTILLAYLIATRIFGRMAGLIGAAIYAFLPVAIQASHFFTVDAWMTFFIFLTIHTCMHAVHRASIWQFSLAGIWFGLALASKTSAAPVGGIILLAIALAALRDSDRTVASVTLLGRSLARASVAFAAFVVVYFIGEPFAFLNPDALLTSFREQADIQSGTWDVPYTQQYVGTTPFSYQLEQATRYTMGPVASLLGMAGVFGLLWLVIRRRSYSAAMLGVWMIGYLAVILFPETKFPRYTLPIAPALAVTSGIAITAVAIWLARRYGRKLAIAFAGVMVLISSSFGAAYATVTTDEHTRLSSSVWMFENFAPGSTKTSEVWDDRLPLSMAPSHSNSARRFDDASINLYGYAPTLGDIATLAPAMESLPNGEAIADAMGAGDIPQATSLLRDTAGDELQEMSSTAQSEFSASLQASADSITTSRFLSEEAQALSERIALENAVTVGDLDQLASEIEVAANESKLRETYNLLDRADYYVLASDRVQRGMEQNPWRYAVPIRMYELLESGEIGFEQVGHFTSSPSLFGYSFPDTNADETFLNYDHPVVTVYEKQDLVSYDEYVQRFGSAALAQVDPGRSPDNEPLTFDEPVSDLPVVHDYRWSESITGSSWGAAIVWVVMLVVIQIAAWPLASSVFRRFPDSGWGLTRLVAMIVPATVLWWLSSVGLLQFRSIWVGVSMLLFAVACWVWLRPRDRSHRVWDFRIIAVAEAIFWITFLVFLVFKMINPDSWHLYWGGEKPMEFAQINAVLRSATFPPVDPWYAQGFINYYYYSFYLVAYLIKLTGIPIEFAFNLAQPMVMGVLASGTFSVGAMLGRRITRGRQIGIMSGLLSVALVSFAGNMLSVAQLVSDTQGETGLIDPFSHWVWAPSRAIIDTENGMSAQMITEFPYFTGLYGDLHSHVVGLPLIVLSIALAATFAFDAFRGESLLSRTSIVRFALAAITLGIIYPTNAWDLPVTAALVAGGIVIGTPSLPSPSTRLKQLLVTIGTIAIGAFVICLPFLWHYEALFGSVEAVRSTTELVELEAHVGGLLLVATAAIPGIIALFLGRNSFAPRAVLIAVLGFILLLRWLAAEQDSDLVRWLDVLTVLAVTIIWLSALATLRERIGRFDLGVPSYAIRAFTGVGALTVVILLLLDNLVATLYIGIAVAATGIWLLKHARAIRFIALLVAGASFIGAGVEFVYLVDDLSSGPWARMNTIFKFYNQIWILLAIAGAAVAGVWITHLFGRVTREPTRSSADHDPDAAGPRRGMALEWSFIATICTVVVLTLSSVYPIVATGERLSMRFEPREGGLTLNAYAWMDYGTVELTDGTVVSFEEDRDVIDWFNAEIGGTPVIAEATFAPYRCNSSRISIGTGLPSVLGWQRHQQQQRYRDVLPQRETDLRLLYATESPEEKLAIINRYDIHYIVVGDLERSYPVVDVNDCVPMSELPQYDELDLDAGIATLEQMEGDSLEIAFQSGDTVVYRVVGNS